MRSFADRLQGQELLAYIEAAGKAEAKVERDDLIIGAGYSRIVKDESGLATYSPRRQDFCDAVFAAQGLGMLAVKEPKPRAARKLSYEVKVDQRGGVFLSAGYLKLLGLEPGNKVAVIEPGDGTLVLSPVAPESIKEPEQAACPAVQVSGGLTAMYESPHQDAYAEAV